MFFFLLFIYLFIYSFVYFPIICAGWLGKVFLLL